MKTAEEREEQQQNADTSGRTGHQNQIRVRVPKAARTSRAPAPSVAAYDDNVPPPDDDGLDEALQSSTLGEVTA